MKKGRSMAASRKEAAVRRLVETRNMPERLSSPGAGPRRCWLLARMLGWAQSTVFGGDGSDVELELRRLARGEGAGGVARATPACAATGCLPNGRGNGEKQMLVCVGMCSGGKYHQAMSTPQASARSSRGKRRPGRDTIVATPLTADSLKARPHCSSAHPKLKPSSPTSRSALHNVHNGRRTPTFTVAPR